MTYVWPMNEMTYNEFRGNLADALNRTEYLNETTVIARRGKPVARLAPLEAPATDCGGCNHGGDDHDAGECWVTMDGTQCACSWYMPVGVMPGPEVWDNARARFDALKKYDDLPADVSRAIEALGKLVNANRSQETA